ncbi:hypothetical protein ACN28I_20470 [Archangium gephyra]|uniref:hypothetical protein n=1 Tax=Archangium gephyra TaxID=48 RepID=UPI003B7DB8F0
MHLRLLVATRGGLLALALLGATQFACVGGHIPPSMFQFQNVVPYRGPGTEPGGWKAAQVLILLGKISPIFASTATCDVEVGVPERNVIGWVVDEFAQAEAAKAADKAARIVLRERLPTALVRAPDHVEHRFRGKWNTDSGASGTPIPTMWNTDSGQVERTRQVGRGMGDTVER